MKICSGDEVRMLRERYPTGCWVELIRMDDMHAPPSGTKGTVFSVDDAGTIHVRWDNGSSLGLVWGEDAFRRI